MKTFSATLVLSLAASSMATDSCAQACATRYNVCRSRPHSNKAFCASEYTSCLGYVPFSGNGSLITPTACSTIAKTSGVAHSTGFAASHPATTFHKAIKTHATGHSSTKKPHATAHKSHKPKTTTHPTAIPHIANTTIPTTGPIAIPLSTSTPSHTSLKTPVWAIKSLIRYCSAAPADSCDYNFKIAAGTKTTSCTISSLGNYGPSESFTNVSCNAKDVTPSYTIDWQFYNSTGGRAVMTVKDNSKRLGAYFSFENINAANNGSSTYGSGHFGDAAPVAAWTY